MDKSNFAARMPGSLPQLTAVVSTNLTGGGKINGSNDSNTEPYRGISNLYAVVCSQVCRSTGLTVGEIFTCNREDCVDARYVQVLQEKGRQLGAVNI